MTTKDERTPARRVGAAMEAVGLNEDEASRLIKALETEGISLITDASRQQFDAIREIGTAIYGGVPGGWSKDDSESLNHLADWLDLIDDATDKAMEVSGKSDRQERTIQSELRRIGQRLRDLPIDEGSLGLI